MSLLERRQVCEWSLLRAHEYYYPKKKQQTSKKNSPVNKIKLLMSQPSSEKMEVEKLYYRKAKMLRSLSSTFLTLHIFPPIDRLGVTREIFFSESLGMKKEK